MTPSEHERLYCGQARPPPRRAAVVDEANSAGDRPWPLSTRGSTDQLAELKTHSRSTHLEGRMFRNPAAHKPRFHRTVTDDELLELLTTLSMVHRRLDSAIAPLTAGQPCSAR